jgi:hypothetical protein
MRDMGNIEGLSGLPAGYVGSGATREIIIAPVRSRRVCAATVFRVHVWPLFLQVQVFHIGDQVWFFRDNVFLVHITGQGSVCRRMCLGTRLWYIFFSCWRFFVFLALGLIVVRVVDFSAQVCECATIGALEHGVIGGMEQATDAFIMPDMGTCRHEQTLVGPLNKG